MPLTQIDLDNSTLMKIDELNAEYIKQALITASNIRKTHLEQLFLSAKNGLKDNVTYIITGDSTRNNSNYALTDYYVEQLSKINVNVVDNAGSGQTALDWLNNTDQNTFAEFEAACTGTDGENTIIEFSFGINDAGNGANSYDLLKARIKDCIDAILLSKPKITIILVTPLLTNGGVDAYARDVYYDLSVEYGLSFVDVTTDDVPRNNNVKYSIDTTHPNIYGGRRIVNYILNSLIPSSIKVYMPMEEVDISTPPTPLELGDNLTSSGYWNTGNGNIETNSSWLRTTNKIAVEPNFTVSIAHSGNQWTIVFYDKDGNFISSKGASYVADGVSEIVLPVNCWFIAFNITSDSATYPITDFSVKYALPSYSFMSVAEINEGLDIHFPRPIPAKHSYKATVEDVDFISLGKNLFDKNNMVQDYFMGSNGYETANTNYSHTKYAVICEPSTIYHTNVALRYVMTYDKDMKKVYPSITPDLVDIGSFVTNPTAKYLIFTVYNTADLNTVQVEKGETETAYEAFNYGIDLPNGQRFLLN